MDDNAELQEWKKYAKILALAFMYCGSQHYARLTADEVIQRMKLEEKGEPMTSDLRLSVTHRRFEAARKSGQLELLGAAEPYALEAALKKGRVDYVVLFDASNGARIDGKFSAAVEQYGKTVVRWEK